ncbi:2OG-Fe(II) oxygenase [Larsenimonas suaedae]|uniref:2OG-Fe(II) oxygenase n=1 Tax=Larsenimonas suaedae TaxID=1851019 RepID=A0ABU1GWM1_9GAMM|nr:2OG-Fe(II) oxygenase [Larsenimonas suaedae]MCM2973009.1 2OG-Fe(II) oxygenase [Larsenimonas suaedae]MDR5896446.1 2OG-Fe(II) oxygenase [Larsenimonas suaedae]
MTDAFAPDATYHPWDTLIDSLVDTGYGVIHNALPPPEIDALLEEFEHLRHHDQLQRAGIGRGKEHQLRDDIRGDSIYWLNHNGPAQARYLERMAAFKDALNYALFLGLFEFEAHFARYPAGSFYKTHVDSLQGRANRMVSTVLYLNQDWPADAGGEMVIYDPNAPERELERVIPTANTLVCFLSETIPHEVRPTTRPRASIAGWYRRNASLNGVVDPAR